MKARRIAVEGPNGVGKSAVTAELARILSPSALFCYPSEAPPNMTACGPRERIGWYLGDMSRGSSREWREQCAGKTIVQDRGPLTTAVYQAGEDERLVEWIMRGVGAVGIDPADVTIVLYLPDEERERRLAASPRGARAELGDAEERARIARLYRHHARSYPGAVEVSAEGPLEDVVARCMAVLV